MFLQKYLLILFISISFSTMAQTKKDYLQNWKKVEDEEKNGLTKSALAEVITIYNLAIKDNNDAQQIKSCMYQIKYRNMVEEDSYENNIFFVDTLIKNAKAPVKNILQSMQAEMFWQYLQNNRWKFYDRTTVKEQKSKDISTWSIDKILLVIAKLYQSSLQNQNLLKTTNIDAIAPIIIKGKNTLQLRPTLFDFLAHRALQYFSTDENQVNKPAYQFKINEANVFSPAAEFVNQNFATKDTASLQYNAILLLQDIIQFHLHDTIPDALIDVDLIRLNFVNQYAVVDDKEKLFETSLKNIEQKYTNNPASAQAGYLRAKIYFDRGEQFKPNSKTENQYEIKRAKELCTAITTKFSKSEGGINCQNLINQINKPTLSIETEKVNIIDAPFRTLVKYKNVSKIYCRIIKTSKNELDNLDTLSNDKLWQTYTSMKSIKSWSIALPDPKDYQQHSTEIKIDPLPSGMYFMLVSIDENFSLDNNIIAKQLTFVSNISFINNNTNEYYVLDRDNGQPLANAKVQVWETKYNYQTSKNDITKAEQYIANKNGMFKIKDNKEYRNISLQVNYNNDELFTFDNERFYNYNSYQASEPTLTTFLFTNRSIYRPGQTIYFKGIVVQTKKDVNNTAIVPSFKTKIILQNANYQKVAELNVSTNDFGSYNGSFKLPEGTLNGQFSIFDSITNEQQFFNVEEYKRPKFFTEILKPKNTYRLNDSIKIIGTAKAYAGNNVDGAKVKYRVVRKVQYPIWWGYFYRGNFGRNEEAEITNGETITNAKGEFNIIFKALPDESVDKKSQPIFYYEVSADVTDINGETRSGSTSIAVAYQMLQLNIDIPTKTNADELKNIKISSTNLNDIFEKTNVNLTITKIKNPSQIFRVRYWQMPDQFVMSKDEYQNYFPYDIYKDEDAMSTWQLLDKVVDINDSTTQHGTFNMQYQTLSEGWYKIIATTKDKYGEKVRAEKYVQIINAQQPTDNTPLTIHYSSLRFQPGDKINYNITTGFDKIWVIHSVSKMNNEIATTYQTIEKNTTVQFVEPVSEQDRGGMAINYIFVQHNRIYSGIQNFEIPWSNKDVNISFNSFRDKLLPNEKEKYTIKITGNKGEKLAAEMLATMYDASLDQFKLHNFKTINIWPHLYNNFNWQGNGFNELTSEGLDEIDDEDEDFTKTYDRLGIYKINKDGVEFTSYLTDFFNSANLKRKMNFNAPSVALEAKVSGLQINTQESGLNEVVVTGLGTAKKKDLTGAITVINSKNLDSSTNQQPPINNNIQIRKNFNETAFFYPNLKTDAEGNISFEYTIPEALTKWKLMTLAHTKDAASGYAEKTLVTQKLLMVQPNAPRFLREGDAIEFSAKIVNLSDTEITGTAQLELLDAATNKPVDGWFKNVFPNQYFTIAAGQSGAVKFPMEVPFNFNSAITYRITAKTNNTSDGEEMALPVLSNRMLVTESLPINLRGTNSKQFKFQKLLNSANNTSLSNHNVTVEYTSNPAWYAVQALPYLMEYPYECAEQTFNRYYANVLASFITNSTPKIKNVFNTWKHIDTAALMSNLEKNQELKSALLQETPWVLDAQNENQQKKNIALLFDIMKMTAETNKAFNTLKQMQSSNGGFVWFKGGPDDRYITQYIITGIGHLRKLNALNSEAYQKIKPIVDKAIIYLDNKIKQDYDNLINYKFNLKNNNLGSMQIQYLYMRSFFTEYKIADAAQTAFSYYLNQSKIFWLSNSKYMQATIALTLYRNSDEATAKAIIKSLKENAITNDELGMYWKEFTAGGYYWYQAPIESQAMMIEAFTDIDKNNSIIDDLKTWLLKQKQTQNWKTTKATAEACYAILLQGNNWLNNDKEVIINLGDIKISSNDNYAEAGTGYFKKKIDAQNIKPQMGNISITLTPSTDKSLTTSWGSVYWQYFEDLDKITPSATPLKLTKQLYKEVNTDKEPILEALSDEATLKIGDKVKVRIELKCDRDMEYVHMKDMRAACMEPVNVLSEYKYQDGLGYYQSTKDASTNFFFNWISRGTYVFEYSLFVTHAGNFSNGITSIQCMYAPEFTSHSEGIRINVE